MRLVLPLYWFGQASVPPSRLPAKVAQLPRGTAFRWCDGRSDTGVVPGGSPYPDVRLRRPRRVLASAGMRLVNLKTYEP